MATATEPIPLAPAVSAPPRRRGALSLIATLQGVYFLVTGVWPLVHIESFLAVTGPKTDLWLVYTVGVLVAVIGTVLLMAARSGRVTPEVGLLAVGSALGLAAIDIIFVAREVIWPVYLLDAAGEGLLILGWAVAALWSRR